MLYVFIRNLGALSLYKRLGFEIVQTVGESRYILKRDSRKYYEAYDERYRIAHEKGMRWMGGSSTPIVGEILEKYRIRHEQPLLEIGCGEGRDAFPLLQQGYRVLATDISREAIAYCKKQMPLYQEHFCVLDCLSGTLPEKFDCILAIAVVHMLVADEDRMAFYRFIRNHLSDRGIALICTMGDGVQEVRSNIAEAFSLQRRQHESGQMLVPATSCRMVSWERFEGELLGSGLRILEKGITDALPDFNSLMYAVVEGENRMEEWILTRPTPEYGAQLAEYRQEFLEADSSMDGCGPLGRFEDMEAYIRLCADYENPATVPEQLVPATQLLFIRKRDNMLVGMLQIRHFLNEYLEKYAGHIGYSVRPSQRRKGYAKQMLKLALPFCRELGLERVLISCIDGNLASEKTILANGGIYESTVHEPDRELYLKRFWISL